MARIALNPPPHDHFPPKTGDSPELGDSYKTLIDNLNTMLTEVYASVSSGTGLTDAIEFVIDGGGSTIATGMKGYIEAPYACTINRATLLADQSGSIVVDIFKCTYSAFDPTTHPASSDKITASAPPTISSAKKSQDSTLTGWTTALSAGDILGFNVNSISTCQLVTLSLKVTRV